MASFELTLSERYGKPIAEQLQALIPLDEPKHYFRRAAGELPQFIQLLADASMWETAFKVAATAYLGRLGYRFADVTIERLGKLRSTDLKIIIDVAQALFDIARIPDAPAKIRIGIIGANRFTPAVLTVAADDGVPAIATALALVASRAQEISDIISDESLHGRAPEAEVSVTPTGSDKILLKWQYWENENKLAVREREI